MEIRFTGLVIDSSDIHEKMYSGWRIPVEWDRIAIHSFNYSDTSSLTKFADEHLTGRYAQYGGFDPDENSLFTVVLFEKTNDAIMFKMLDGEQLLKNP